MSTSSEKSRAERALDHLRRGTTDEFESQLALTASSFTDPEQHAAEIDKVFGRVPLIAVHGSELPKPNDFVTMQLPRNNVILVRQKDGSVKGFVNACRHRGALIENQGKGRRRLFSCPYHRWSYDTDGSLRTVTHEDSFGETDRPNRGLVELPVEERHGFVWIIDRAGERIDVKEWLGPEMDQILADGGTADMVVHKTQTFAHETNWKVLQTAFIDSYHIQYAHPNTAGRHVHTNVMVSDDFGRHSRFMNPKKSIDKWLEEEPDGVDLDEHVIDTHFVLPNSTLMKLPDHWELLSFRPHPRDPRRAEMDIKVIVPTAEAAGMHPEQWERKWAKLWQTLEAVLIGEDFPILGNSQIAVDSRDAGDMVIGRNEVINHYFYRELNELMK